MNTHFVKYKNFFYPPGGILLWMIIFVEMLSFGLALVAFSHYSSLEPDVFHQSRQTLHARMATINTLILLTSGYFMAVAVNHFKNQLFEKARTSLLIATGGGLVFVVVKAIEYAGKLEAGLTLSSNMFFTFYWLLTGFHLIHVITGLVILLAIGHKLRQQPASVDAEDVEAGGAFWHMCDLIWLMLFPVLYLF